MLGPRNQEEEGLVDSGLPAVTHKDRLTGTLLTEGEVF